MDVPHEVEGEGDAKPVPTPPTSSSTPHEPLADDSSIDAAHSVVDEEPKRLLSLSNLKILVVPVTCGLFYGYNIVFVAVYYQMHLMSMDCSMAKGGKVVCETLPSADCRWYTNSSSGGYCGWTDVTCRVLYPNSKKFGGNEDSARSGCLQDNRCTWSYGDSECKNPVGLDSLRYAVFAVAMTIGGVFGSWAGGPVVSALGSKLSFVCAGIVSCACCLMYHVGIGTDEFWVIIGARVVLGFCIGITGVASPLYVDQNAPKEFKRPIGFLYMISVCFGILLVSIMGLALGQSVEFSSNVDTHLVARLQGVTSLSSVISVGVVCLGLFVKESRVNFNRDVAVKGAVEVNPDEYTYREMLPQLLVAFIMTCAYQLTGANSITSYAPTIMGNLGLAPLVGTFLMMLVCFLCSISSILLSNRVSSRTIFLTGSFTLSTICVCLCGIPVYPGVASEEVKNIVAVIGTLSFMGVFQLCLGPCFYVLTQELFPLSFRPKGASFTQTSQFLLNGVVCAAYPFAAEGLSGGAAGNQNKGQSIVFMSFGVIGFVCSTLEAFFSIRGSQRSSQVFLSTRWGGCCTLPATEPTGLLFPPHPLFLLST